MSRPLSPEAAAVINEFKRSGQFDKLRKSLFQEFKESSTHNDLRLAVKDVVDSQVSKDRGLLRRERGKGAALIEGSLSLHSGLDSPATRDRSSTRYRSSHHHPQQHRHPNSSNNTGSVSAPSRPAGTDVFGKAHEYVRKNTVDSVGLWKNVSEQVEGINKDMDAKGKDAKELSKQ